jgi:hypothetical protein
MINIDIIKIDLTESDMIKIDITRNDGIKNDLISYECIRPELCMIRMDLIKKDYILIEHNIEMTDITKID